MITNLDRQCIDSVIASAISVIYLYDREHPETHEVLHDQLLKLAHSTTDDAIISESISNELPEHILVAFQDLGAYLYSSHPRSDFFLTGSLPPSLEEIQSYIRSMLFSINYYMNPDSKAPAPNAYEVDIFIKQILHPQSAKSKKDITYKNAIDHANKKLNFDENITVYKQIKKPIHKLFIEKRKYDNDANNPQSIAFKQRLYFLELLNDISSSQYTSTRPRTRIENFINLGNNIPQNNGVVANNFRDLDLFIPLFFSILAGCLYIYTRHSNNQISSPVWPAGMTGLSQSTANLEYVNAGFKLASLNNVNFPLSSIDDYRLLAVTSFNTRSARDLANHGDLGYGLEQILERIYVRTYQEGMKFIELYITIWAFLSEHGRNIAYQAETYGLTFHIAPAHAQSLRALEALRYGLEALLKEKYPEYYAQISCDNHKDPLQQIGALNDLVKLEFESQHNLYKERITLFKDWLDMMKQYSIHYPALEQWSRYDSYNKGSYIRTSLSVTSAMRQVMEDNNCPWWQDPLGFVSETAGSFQNTLCTAWQKTKPILSNSDRHDDDNIIRKRSSRDQRRQPI